MAELKNYLACMDLGNTSLKLRLVEGARMQAALYLPYRLRAREAFNQAAQWLSGRGVERAALCSVNPPAAKALKTLLKKRGITVSEITSGQPEGLLTSRYNLSLLGADRWTNLVAARQGYGAANLLVVSCGTALVMDVLEGDVHAGGIIAPGLDLCFASLHENTGLLPRAKFLGRTPLLGTDTQEAIGAGCTGIWLGGIRQMAQDIARQRKRKFRVIVTGGDAEIARLALPGAVVDPDLTFRGIRALAEAKK